MEDLVVYRTYLLAKKLLQKKDQQRILKSFAKITEYGLEVDSPAQSRTEIGKRSFSSRVKRLWSVLPEELKNGECKTKKQKE